jgi:hypothetical protein
VRDTLTGATYPQPNKLIALKVAQMHGNCEVVPATQPTPDEREALAKIIDVGTRVWGACSIGFHAAADAILAAGFHRQGPITDDTEWEYSIQITNGTIAPQPFDDLHEASVAASLWRNGSVVRRRKAGPWEPIEAAAKA